MRILKYISIFLAISLGILYFLRNPLSYQTMTGQTMGTYYSIKVRNAKENQMLHNAIKASLAKVNQQMSVFDKDSEISAINNAPANEWIELSPEMRIVLKNAYDIYKKSGGHFDPTVGKLVDLWGFGTSRPKRTPTEEELKAALKVTGFNKIHFSPDFKKLKKDHQDITINLSAIAKGYGVDQIAALLRESRYQDFVVEIGGEVYASGQKSDEVPGWNIGIIKPVNNYNENAYVITLKDMAVATSGDYRNFIYVDDKKFSHTISPQNGRPVESNLISVTVFDKSAMVADGLSTAMMAKGDKKAIDFANRNNLAVIMFMHGEDNTVKTWVSNRAKKLIGE